MKIIQKNNELYYGQGIVSRLRKAIFGDSRQQRRMKNMVDAHAIIIEDVLDRQLEFTRRLDELEKLNNDKIK